MGVHRYFIQLSPARLRALKADIDSVEHAIANDEVNEYPECTVEKTWDAIEFMLLTLSRHGFFPPKSPIFKPSDLGFASYWSPKQVSAIAAALSGINDKLLRAAYEPLFMQDCNVYPKIWDRIDHLERNFQWIREYFRAWVKYVRTAAARGNAMLRYSV